MRVYTRIRLTTQEDGGFTDTATTSQRATALLVPRHEPEVLAANFPVWDHTAPALREKTRRKRKEWTPGRIVSVCNLYLSDIVKTITGRHPKGGGPIHDGRRYFEPAVNLLVARYVAMKDSGRNPKPVDVYAWATKHTPRLAAEQPRAWFDEVQRRAFSVFDNTALPPRLRSADEIADMIGTTAAEFVAFKLRAIGCIDRRAPQRKAEEKLADRRRKSAERISKGAIPHSQSMAAQKPWVAYGVSEPTFRRWVRIGKVPPHPSQDQARAKAKRA